MRSESVRPDLAVDAGYLGVGAIQPRGWCETGSGLVRTNSKLVRPSLAVDGEHVGAVRPDFGVGVDTHKVGATRDRSRSG